MKLGWLTLELFAAVLLGCTPALKTLVESPAPRGQSPRHRQRSGLRPEGALPLDRAASGRHASSLRHRSSRRIPRSSAGSAARAAGRNGVREHACQQGYTLISPRTGAALVALLLGAACQKNPTHARGPGEGPATPHAGATTPASAAPEAPLTPHASGPAPSLPLQLVADVELPGRSTRFDYQDVDPGLGELVVSHMNDGEVLFLRLADAALLARVGGIPVARGVAFASELQRVFITSSPHTLVVIDAKTHSELARATTGAGPDGVAWDPIDRLVGVSDQRDGALSLLADAGTGARRALKLGRETGNVIFDARRAWFWITVAGAGAADQLVGVLPSQARIAKRWPLPGCEGAHGLRLAPDAQSAFIACEANHRLLQVDLEAGQVLATLATGEDPDVLSIDPGLGWLYVAAESGDLAVFEINSAAATLLGHDHPGPSSHSVAVDPSSHHVFFPLKVGPTGKPVLRIMKPTGT